MPPYQHEVLRYGSFTKIIPYISSSFLYLVDLNIVHTGDVIAIVHFYGVQTTTIGASGPWADRLK